MFPFRPCALVWANAHLGSYNRLRWREIAAVAMPAGVGFTVSLLIGGLAYQEPAQFERVATAVLIASLLASASAAVAFRIRVRQQACGDAG
jgi:NhaA family Na+:H+ antiporter